MGKSSVWLDFSKIFSCNDRKSHPSVIVLRSKEARTSVASMIRDQVYRELTHRNSSTTKMTNCCKYWPDSFGFLFRNSQHLNSKFDFCPLIRKHLVIRWLKCKDILNTIIKSNIEVVETYCLNIILCDHPKPPVTIQKLMKSKRKTPSQDI